MDPLTMGLIAGGTSLAGNLFSGFGGQSEARKRNRRIDAEKNRVASEYGAEKERLTQGQRSLATDFLTNYITIRDKDRADSLRGEYGRNQSEFSTALSRMLSEKNQLMSGLEMQKQDAQSTGSIIGQGVASGIGAGMQGYAAGKQFEALEGLSKTASGIDQATNSVSQIYQSSTAIPTSIDNSFSKYNSDLGTGLFNEWKKKPLLKNAGYYNQGSPVENRFDL